MDLSSPGYWLAIVLPAVATFLGVVFAFWLERIAERRRADENAFWAARHWTRAIARTMTDETHVALLRLATDGRRTPRRGEVYRQLAEVDPELAMCWFAAIAAMMKTYEAPGWFRSRPNERFWAWAKHIDDEFDRASRAWPPRGRRLDRLKQGLSAGAPTR